MGSYIEELANLSDSLEGRLLFAVPKSEQTSPVRF